ncbi:MAG: PAS domain-containing protein, partial [Fulvivirga sp.]
MTSIKSLQYLFALIITIALLLSYLTYRSLNKMINDAQWVNSTNIVLGELEKIISLVKDGEIAYRGYQLTADSLYLEPYHSSKWMALSKIQMIDSLMRNEKQQVRVDTLRRLVERQYNIIEYIIRQGQSFDDYSDSLLYASNENITNLTILLDEIKGEEVNLLRQRVWAKNDPDKITPILIFMSFVFAIGVVVYLFSQIYKSLKTKIVAERALEKNLMQLSKEVNEKIRAQESLQSVLDSSPNGILFMEAIRVGDKIVDFKLLFGNRSVEKHLNVTLEQILGKRLLELFSGNIEAAALDICMQATETGEEIEKEFYYQDNKIEAWFYVTAVRLDDGCVITFTDTTAQKKTAKIIEESRQKFEAIFNKAFQFIGLLDVNGRFLDINQTALEFSGISKEIVIGKFLWSTSWGSQSKEAEVRVQWAVRKAARGEFIRYEVNVTGSKGNVLPIDFSLKPIKDEHGDISFIILEGRDLKEIKRAEAERSFISMLNLTIANSNSFDQAINRIFHHIAERFDLDYCEVWLPEGDELVLSEIYYARDKKLAQLHRNSIFSRLKRGEGLPGRVMETFEMHYIEDIDSVMEERFIRMDKAMDFGLTTAFGIPII